jgi:uncharacterized protein YjbI with pentapeptide repeats
MLNLDIPEEKEMYDKLSPTNRESVVKGRNKFFFSNFKNNKKMLKNRKDLDHSDFHTTTLDGANLSNSNLESSKFFNADLLDTVLKGANLKNSKFEFGIVDGANFEGANLEGVTFEGVEGLDRANFKGTIFESEPGYGNNYTGKSKWKEVNELRKESRKKMKLEKEMTKKASMVNDEEEKSKGGTKKRKTAKRRISK